MEQARDGEADGPGAVDGMGLFPPRDDTHRAGVAAASAHWLLTAFPPAGGLVERVRAEATARSAAWVALVLRYPTDADDLLLELCGPGGTAGLDSTASADLVATSGAPQGSADETPGEAWRTWVDEVVVSWAAALLTDPELAAAALAATGEPACGPLVAPTAADLAGGALLRHPDLLTPVAALHGAELQSLLRR